MAHPSGPTSSSDRSAAGHTAAVIGEDVGRILTGRVAIFVALLCLSAGAWAEADAPIRSAGLVAGGAGLLAIVVVALSNPSRRVQWTVVLATLLLCGALTVVMLLQHRAAVGV